MRTFTMGGVVQFEVQELALKPCGQRYAHGGNI